MCLRQVARLGEEQRHRLLGRGENVRLWRVDDHHAPAGGRRHVDVVEPDAGPTDDDEVGTCLEHVRRDLGRGADDEAMRAGHRLPQLVGREAQALFDLVARFPKVGEAARGQLLGHEDPGHRRHAGRNPRTGRRPLSRAAAC